MASQEVNLTGTSWLENVPSVFYSASGTIASFSSFLSYSLGMHTLKIYTPTQEHGSEEVYKLVFELSDDWVVV